MGTPQANIGTQANGRAFEREVRGWLDELRGLSPEQLSELKQGFAAGDVEEAALAVAIERWGRARPIPRKHGGRALDQELVKRIRVELETLPPDERQPSRRLRKWIRENHRLWQLAKANTLKIDRYIRAAN